jgi:C-terminal processing protease CtpA/Prc
MKERLDLDEYCGLLTTKDADGDWVIAFVGGATPADAAGLRKGDKLIALNGRSANGMTRDDVIQICRAPGPLDVELRRGTQTQRVTVLRRKLI